MTWLFGKPSRTRSLVWPPGDADLGAHRGTVNRREGWSLIDGLVVYWIALNFGDNHKTVLYLADTTRAGATDAVAFERVAELDYATHRLVAIPQVGFATVEWMNEDSAVKFRSHSLTGSILQECKVSVKAAYGELSPFNSTVSLCVSSGDPPPAGHEDVVSSDIQFLRLDYVAGVSQNQPMDLIADEILTWETSSGELKRVKIPLDDAEPMTHSADFQYLGPDRIALAGSLFDEPQAILKCFSTGNGRAGGTSFSQGEHTNPESIKAVLGHPGSTDTSRVLVHDHDGGRITVFKRDILSSSTSSTSQSDDPPALRMVFQHPNDARTLRFSLVPGSSVSGNRVLVKDSNAMSKALYILDFDQERLATLLAKQPAERAALRDELAEARARVKVVTRRFHCGIEETEDREYPHPATCPLEWASHLREVLNRKGNDSGEPLEFDEAPVAHRQPLPFGFVQSALQVGRDRINVARVAITTHSVIEVPKPGKQGYIFDFEA